jgi:glyoxylase-like metal-dependent hydrolase (beta-lactamase superfamily II)
LAGESRQKNVAKNGAAMKQIHCAMIAMWLLGSVGTAGAGPFHYEFHEVAPAVWTGIRPDSPKFPVMGNTTFVVSDQGVVVFDGGGVAAMAEQIIEKIRSVTAAPVTHVIISHWHGDHNFGIYRFAEEFPNVQFVAHSFTGAAMNGSPVDYISNYPEFVEKNVPEFKDILEKGIDSDDTELTDHNRQAYEQIISDADEISAEFKRVKLTTPGITFDKKLVIHSGKRRIELLHLGHGNTEGDIVMWLPEERLVATGDLVVLPTPYAFNVPPRAWAATLRNLNGLGYAVLIPGHGEIQTDTRYVDLVIEAAESIADQRDELLAKGLSHEELETQLDFGAFESRFTGGDEYIKGYYNDWFEQPLRKAAIKALSGESMVVINPKGSK